MAWRWVLVLKVNSNDVNEDLNCNFFSVQSKTNQVLSIFLPPEKLAVMSSEIDEALIQHKEDGVVESQTERQEIVGNGFEIRRIFLNLKQSKSLEILKSALGIFTSNTKFMFFMLLSILPFFVCMVFCEIKLQKLIIYATLKHLVRGFFVENVIILGDYIVPLLFFYLFLNPLLQFFSMIFTMKVAVKLHALETPITIREVLNQNISIGGPFITYLCIHLLSAITFLGLFWVVSNHSVLTINYYYCCFYYTNFMLNVLVFTVHLVLFLGLLYKYLDWSAYWNMGMVISVEEQIGIEAFGMSAYYGKHCKNTGFQLMLGLFVFGNVLRLPFLYAGLCDGSVAGVLITSGVMMVFSMGNLVKWIAFMLYFNYCKQQTMEKKIDDQELGRSAEL